MAIKVGNAEVITNARALTNIADADGISGSFHATLQTITTVIDFTKPMTKLVMSSNVTFTEANATDAFKGSTSMLLLDTSATGYTPTFSANVKWPASTTPTWSGSRYWMIAFQLCNLGVIRANAQGYGTAAAASPDVVMNNTPWAGFVYASSLGGAAQCNFRIASTGIASMSNVGSNGGGGATLMSSETWLITGAASDYDVRWSFTGSTGDVIANPGNGVWLNLGTSRTWSIRDSDYNPGVKNIIGNLQIRNASTLVVLATGTLSMSVDFEP